MDYKEKYNNLLCRLQALVDVQPEVTKECFYKEFPELAESEDEKIRKDIISLIKETSVSKRFYDLNKMLSWLEKQKEATDFASLMNKLSGTEQQVMFDAWEYDKKKEIENLKPVEWSEEDKFMLDGVIDFLESGRILGTTIKGMIDWLKSLRNRYIPQKQWKPSEEQIKALRFATTCVVPRGYFTEIRLLTKLLEQLKAL